MQERVVECFGQFVFIENNDGVSNMVIENRLQNYSNKLPVIRDFREQNLDISIQEVF